MSGSPVEIEYNGELKPLADVLAGVKRPGDFYVSGSLVAPLPRLDVDGVGTVCFPLPEIHAREITRQAEQAPYGKGEQTLIDTTVRKVWQVAPSKVRLSGAMWAATFETILAQVVQGLGCQQAPVTAELYKLLLYDTGGFFVSHRDTEKIEGMFGTLVIVLPSLHRGGELVVRHAGREVSLDLETKDVSQLTFAAFYADCEHEVRPVKDGNRLCLIYNLVQQRGVSSDREKRLTAPDHDSEIGLVVKLLADWTKRSDTPPKIVYLLEHQYSPAGLSFSGLKNADAVRGKVLAQAAQRAGCAVHLGIVHIKEEGTAEVVYSARDYRSRWRRDDDDDEGDDEETEDEFEVVEVIDSHQYIGDWVDPQNRAVGFGAIPLGEDELFPDGALDDEKPDEQRVMEATGNEGASFERSYRRAVIVLWNEQRYPEVLLQAGPDAALPYLRKRIQEWSSQSKSSVRSESWPQVASLAELITDEWAAGTRSYAAFLNAENRATKRAEMLELLGTARDANLIQRFIEKVVLPQYDGSENEQLAACSQLLEPPKAGELLSALVEKNMSLMPCACVELLSRLVSGQSRNPAPRLIDANRKVAEAVVKALSKTNPSEDDASRYTDGRRSKQVRPIEATSVATLFNVLRQLEAATLSDTAAGSFIAYPKTYAPDTVLVPALSGLHQQHGDKAADAAFLSLWEHSAKFLLARSEFAPPQPTDWAQPAKLHCRCTECRELQAFAEDPASQVHRFRVRQDRRHHLHQAIERHQLDMTHETERIGLPHTLVCTKTRRSYERRCQKYARDIGYFKTLGTLAANLPKELESLLHRLHQAIDCAGR